MPCGCGKKKQYVVTDRDGNNYTVDTLTAAMNIVRRKGGHYNLVKAA